MPLNLESVQELGSLARIRNDEIEPWNLLGETLIYDSDLDFVNMHQVGTENLIADQQGAHRKHNGDIFLVSHPFPDVPKELRYLHWRLPRFVTKLLNGSR